MGKHAPLSSWCPVELGDGCRLTNLLDRRNCTGRPSTKLVPAKLKWNLGVRRSCYGNAVMLRGCKRVAAQAVLRRGLLSCRAFGFLTLLVAIPASLLDAVADGFEEGVS